MSDLVGNPEDRFSCVAAQMIHDLSNVSVNVTFSGIHCNTKLVVQNYFEQKQQ